ncbi:TIGR02678 family protein [Amycolatopsis sp. lyj-23]|uniref:TIGR02678 family protein n=1 Tax=Amycolatopsis sp. lyj-23 TaxID=2789283 RepID=UPI00397B759D
MSRDAVERQRAFTGLLAHPVLDRRRHPELFALVRNVRHRPVLIEWFSARLGYRLVVTESAARLFRLPLAGEVLAPRRLAAPSRRVLVLAVLAAAAAEDAEDITTTQDLSDRVRALAAHDEVGLAPYDPDRFAERQLFDKAVGLLIETGALRGTGRDAGEQREGWTHRRDTVGGAYEVERELLVRMVDPAALAATLGDNDEAAAVEDSAARFGLMRRLIELPVCLLADLDDACRAYLSSQRHRVLAWCAEMTGWVVEQRAEGLALIAAEESDTDLPFPRLRAVDFATLMVLNELRKYRQEGGVVSEGDLGRAVTEVRARHPRAMTKELDTGLALRDRAVELLQALDLLRGGAAGGTWWLSPAAERFRDPRVVSVTARLDETETE